MNYKIRSVCTNDEGDILIGTRGGEILEIQDNSPKVCLRGHFDGELWGLCVHPKKDIYYTVVDGVLHISHFLPVPPIFLRGILSLSGPSQILDTSICEGGREIRYIYSIITCF